MRFLLTCLFAALSVGTISAAEPRETLGIGRIFNNDALGDGADRWRTGSYTFSLIRGRDDYTGTEKFGDLLEYRIQTQIIAASRRGAAPGDRPYVGSYAVGVATHFAMGETHLSLGADIEAIGPQTQLAQFQAEFHDTFGLQTPLYTDTQVPDEIFLNASAAASRSFALSDRTTFRPFVEARVGAEDLLRVGGDFIIGEVAQQDLLLRDVVTGQLYQGTEGDALGLSFVVGADMAQVWGSKYLPADMGYEAAETRVRARVGVFWQLIEDVSFFYGATYLSEEFEGQHDSQIVGSLKVNFSF